MPSLYYFQCQQCQHTDCSSLHRSRYLPADCPVPSCDVCPTLEEVETEISLTHNHLVELSKKRKFLKSLINERHDPLTSRLPTELLSEIFALYCKNAWAYERNKAPVIIGEVCRRWRDVTLGTPQLWSNVVIHLNAFRNLPCNIDVAEKWLSRSRTLPLTLEICFSRYLAVDPENKAASPMLQLLRSHSSRWEHLSVESCQPSFLQALVDNLKDMPLNLESFSIASPADGIVPSEMHRLLCPRTLHATEESSTFGLPFGWERLTSLSTENSLYLDEVIHIIHNAPDLAACTISEGALEYTDAIDIPDSKPVINRSLTFLDYEESLLERPDNILHFLTLPSLETLRYTYRCDSPDDSDFDITLRLFLDRSSPPLQEFYFLIQPSHRLSSIANIRCPNIPSITSLGLDTTKLFMRSLAEIRQILEIFLFQLSQTLKCAGLPKLERLVLHVKTSPEFWSALCNLFPDPPLILNDHAQRSNNPETAGKTPSVPKFPPSVHIYPSPLWEDSSIRGKVPKVSMSDAVFARLIEIEKSGVELVLRRRDLSGRPGTWKYPLSAALNTPPQS